MLNKIVVEQRLAKLEGAVAILQDQAAKNSAAANWLEAVVGSISDEAAFLEALEHGRNFRYADRPPDDDGEPS